MIKRPPSFINKILYNQKFLALLGLVLIFLISFPLAKNVSKRYKINQEIEEINEEIAEFESKNKDLKQLIIYLESDQFVEEQARLNLGLRKQGEEVTIIKDISSGLAKEIEENKLENSRNFSNPEKWWNYFF